MVRIVVLANSIRPDGMCIAGIDLDTGEWVRPVPPSGDGIPTQRCFVNGKMLAIRDVLECDLIRPCVIPQYQCENQTVRNWNWQVTGRLKASAIRKYVEGTCPILHTPNDRVGVNQLNAMPPQDWRSLQLACPRGLHFERHYYDANRWVASFSDGAGNRHSLKITDPVITRRLESEEQIDNENCLLTVSMTKPWTHDPSVCPPTCYKIVAGVIAL